MASQTNQQNALDALEQQLGYRFVQRDLLIRALTHRSASSVHNERLEFLGDGILNFVVAAALFKTRRDAPEGDLSRLRASLVCERTLAAIANELALGPMVVMGPGEQGDGSRRRASVRADTVEAVLGAIFLDGGFDAAERVVQALFDSRLSSLPSADSLKDAKTQLQEWLQARGRKRPEYELVRVTGADHCQQFVSRCRLTDSSEAAEGEGAGRRKAEQAAARHMMKQLNGSKHE